MVGFSLKIPFDFLTAAGRSKSPGGGDGLAINILSPTNSFEAKGSGILRDDTLIDFSSFLGSYQRCILHTQTMLIKKFQGVITRFFLLLLPVPVEQRCAGECCQNTVRIHFRLMW